MKRTSINANSTLLFLVQFNYVPIENTLWFMFFNYVFFFLDKNSPYLLPSSYGATWNSMFFFLKSNFYECFYASFYAFFMLLWRTFSNIFAHARSITSVEFPLSRFKGKALWNLTVLYRTYLLWTSSEIMLLDYFLLYIFTNQSLTTFEITFFITDPKLTSLWFPS